MVLGAFFDQSHVKQLGKCLQLDVPHMDSSAIPSHDRGHAIPTDLEQLLNSVKDWLSFAGDFTHARMSTSERHQ